MREDDWDSWETDIPSPNKSFASLCGTEVESNLAPSIIAQETDKKPPLLKREFNFEAETAARKFDKLKGLNEAKLEEEIQKYAQPMDSYDVPDLEAFERAIATWDLELPEVDCTDEATLALTYHRLNNYLIRLNQMLREAKAYQMVARTAYDHLMDVAQKVYPGSNQAERKGAASYRLQAFFEAKNQSDYVVEVLNDWARILDKMHFRLRDGIEHIRAATRVNRAWNAYGEAQAYERLGEVEVNIQESPTAKATTKIVGSAPKNAHARKPRRVRRPIAM